MLTCLHCGSDKHEVVYKFSSLSEFKKFGKEKDIVKCSDCSLIYCSPRETEESMLEVYENDYWHDFQVRVGERKIEERHKEFEYISAERVRYVKQFKSSGKFLDVGCSLGYLVNAAKLAGFNSHGIDLNQKDLDHGKQKYDINLTKSLLQNYDNSDFDVITSFNVIEHVTYPDKMLSEMKKRLNKDGVVVIGTHDIDCKNHIKEGQKWKHIIPNEHLYYFNIETLKKVASKSGLELFYYNKPIENSIVGYFRHAE